VNQPILLVEDNSDDELLTLRAFKKSNILNRIDVVRDGQEALDYFNRQGLYVQRSVEENPELILLDLKLPKVDGIEVLKFIRGCDQYNNIPVVVLTSSDQETDIDYCYAIGANSYLCKPVDFNDFMRCVQQVGRYWLLMNVTRAKTVETKKQETTGWA